MRTEDAFREVYPQSVADFVLGCQRNVISVSGREKFCKLFGVDPIQSDGNECLRTHTDVFTEQALWGERGIIFGDAACSNHIEWMHGRLNAHLRFVEITSVIIASPANWSKKVERGWHATKAKLESNAREQGSVFHDYQESADCDKGLLLSRRLGRQVPCVHTISTRGWPNEPPPAQLSVTTIAPPDISFTEFNGEWRLEVGQKRHTLEQIEYEIEAVVMGAEISPGVRTIVRVRREITMLNPPVHFKYSLDNMLVRLGKIRGELRVTFRSSLTEPEIK
jgi:hypothetical protein